jgi:hydroxymethylpyrimidine pyrophosphatase-like HAD family hydrolase
LILCEDANWSNFAELRKHFRGAVCQALGLNRSEVAAIDAYLNDVEIAEWAGLLGAVSNAAPEVKAVADILVSSNEYAGVAEFIDSALPRAT